MKHLNIDIETYSNESIKDVGLYKYVSSSDFQVLLFAYSVDFGEVKIVDLTQGELIPDDVIKAMADDNVLKHAYNAAFEYNALKDFGIDVGTRSGWRCTMFHAMYLGYPAGLSLTGNAIGIDEDKKKLNTGKALIRYFCVPCKPTKVNGQRTRNLPHHDMDKWELFKEYCKQDVVAELEIYNRLALFDVPITEQKLWELSDEMNALGVKLDKQLVDGALTIDRDLKDILEARAKEITKLNNVNSTAQVKAYLDSVVPGGVANTTKDTIASLLTRDDIEEDVKEFLRIRQELAKTSTTKYTKMDMCMCEDYRVRGLLQCYGANRTGRWAGRLVQVQNLPRNYIENLDIARDVIKSGNLEALQLLFGNASDTLSQMIRTAFIADSGKRFVVADYSAIEARVIAWLAGEEWVNEVFATHGKIYEATASQMFNVPLEKIKKGNPEYALRQRGKVATLALGYQGGVGALVAMGADKFLNEEEMEETVTMWRNANPNIVKFWYALDKACINAILTGREQQVRNVIVRYESEGIYGQKFLTIELPSGRKLYYPQPTLKENQFGKLAVHFKSLSGVRWISEGTYGGKLTENVVQAIARDCLGYLLLVLRNRLDSPVVMHIHDEVVIEADSKVSLDEVCRIMAEPVSWAPGLILKGAGFESEYYKKD